jgi:probable HAF family extracellular repeat protein
VLVVALLASTALVAAPKAEAAGEFSDLYSLATHGMWEVTAMSGNGRYLAMNGSNARSDTMAYHYDNGSVTQLGGLDRTQVSLAYGISDDGSTVVGSSEDPYVRTRGFRWTADEGMIDLGTLRSDDNGWSWAYDTSADGRMVVGSSSSEGDILGFVWIEGATTGAGRTRQMFALDPLAPDEASGAYAISNDGRYVAGHSSVDDESSERTAMRWDVHDIEAGNQTALSIGYVPAGISSEARAISSDGSVVAGFSTLADYNDRAFRWVEGVGIQDLGVLDNHMQSRASAVSGDGRVVSGRSEDGDGIGYAFRWDESAGMVAVADWLSENGVDVGEVRLAEASALSHTGDIVAGRMVDEDGEDRAYIARVNRPQPEPEPQPQPQPQPPPPSGIMDVAEYRATLYSASGIANAGEFLTWLPMNGAHHRPLMQTPSLSEDMCVWATGDFASHGPSSTGLALAEAGACVDLAGGNVRIGASVGTSGSWQPLALGGSARMAGQYVLSEIDWQPNGTPLLLSVTGMVGGWGAHIDRAYSNGAATAVSNGTTQLTGGVVRVRADWLEAASIGNTSLNPWASVSLGHLHVNGYTESGGPFPAVFNAQSLGTTDMRVGLTAITEFSSQTRLSTTFEVAHRTGTAAAATGTVPGLFDFSLGGGTYGQTWARLGAELDHEINDALAVSASVHLATNGRDPSVAGSIGFKGTF